MGKLLDEVILVPGIGKDTAAAAVKYADKLKALFGANLIAYWPLNETSGTAANDISGNSRNGTYSGCTLANAASPIAGDMAPYFDGINGYISIFSSSFDAAFNGDEGSLLVWCKVNSSANYSDSVHHTVFHLAFIGDHHIWFIIQNNGELSWYHKTDGAAIDIRSTEKPLAWFHAGLTWSLSNHRVRAYLNGAQVGSDQTGQTAMSTYMIDSQAMVGAFTNTPYIPWHGWIAHCAILDREATAAEVLQAATP